MRARRINSPKNNFEREKKTEKKNFKKRKKGDKKAPLKKKRGKPSLRLLLDISSSGEREMRRRGALLPRGGEGRGSRPSASVA